MKKLITLLLLFVTAVSVVWGENDNICNKGGGEGWYESLYSSDRGCISFYYKEDAKSGSHSYTVRLPGNNKQVGSHIKLTPSVSSTVDGNSFRINRDSYNSYNEDGTITIYEALYAKISDSNIEEAYQEVYRDTINTTEKNTVNHPSKSFIIDGAWLSGKINEYIAGKDYVDVVFVDILKPNAKINKMRWGWVRSDSCVVRVYNCSNGIAGTITANKTLTPVLNVLNGDTTFAVYPTSANGVDGIQILVGKNPLNLSSSSKWVLSKFSNGIYWPADIETKKINQESELSKPKNYQYSQLIGYGLDPGTEYSVTRTMNFGANYANCSTNPVYFKIVDAAVLDGFVDTKKYVCEEPNASFVDSKNVDDLFLIQGNKLNIDDKSNAYKDIYGVEYYWEYKESTSAVWKKLAPWDGETSDDNYNFNSAKSGGVVAVASHYSAAPQDLYVSKKLIKAGKTYQFRQYAVLTGFSNREIRATDNGVISVTAYNSINASDFSIEHMGSFCADGESKEVRLKAWFNPELGANYKYADETSTSGLMQYQWVFPIAESGSVLADTLNQIYNVLSEEQSKEYATVTITDGCSSSVTLKDSVIFEKRPVLDPNYIVCSNANVYYDNTEDAVIVDIPEGILGQLRVSPEDEDYKTSGYLYSYDGSTWSELFSKGLGIRLTTEMQKNLFIKKKAKNGELCESVPVEIRLVRVAKIVGNTFKDSVIYVCNGGSNPAISPGEPEGGYIGGTWSYKWLYSADGATYSAMQNTSGIITTQNLSAKDWNIEINREYWIKRIANNTLSNGIVRDTSNVIKIRPFSTPVVTLQVEKNKACYREENTFSTTLDSIYLLQRQTNEDEGLSNPALSYQLSVKNHSGKYDNVSEATTPKWIGKMKIGVTGGEYVNDIYLYYSDYKMTVNVCGSDVTSDDVRVYTPWYLEPKVTEGSCRVMGKTMSVSIDMYEGFEDRTYTYGIYNSDGIQLGSKSAEIPVPVDGSSFSYTVKVSDGECFREDEHTVSTGIRDSMLHSQLLINQSVPIGRKCAGEEYTFSSNTTNSSATIYEWRIDDAPIENEVKSSMNYSLPGMGKTYKIVRISKDIQNGMECEAIKDSCYIRTYDAIDSLKLTLDKSGIVCDGDVVNYEVGNLHGGSQVYNYQLTVAGKEIVKGTIDPINYQEGQLTMEKTGANVIKAIVTDQNCSAYSKTVSKTLTQAGSAEFTAKVTPSMVTDADKQSVLSITTEASDGSSVVGDAFSYSYVNSEGKGTTGAKTGSPFSLTVDSAAFTSGLLRIGVERTVSSTGCKASDTVYVTRSSGFEDRPGLSRDALTDVVCGGELVVYKVASLPMFGEKSLKQSDVTIQWYRNGSKVADGDSCALRAVAGDTSVVMCKVSYKYDSSQRAAYVFSDEMRLIGREGVSIGRVTESTTSTPYVYACVGDDGEVILNGDVSKSAGDSLEWQQSDDGIIWGSIPASNLSGATNANLETVTINKSSYTTSGGRYYFRLTGKSQCGTVTSSSNMIVFYVDTLPSAPLVALRSSNLIDSTQNSLIFSPTSDYKGYMYKWGLTEDDLNADQTQGGAQAILNGEFGWGEHTIYVQKVSTHGGQCSSALSAYTFKLYDDIDCGLVLPNVADNYKRCPSETTEKIGYVIGGGSGVLSSKLEYNTGTVWFEYKGDGTDPFNISKFDTASTGKFFTIVDISQAFALRLATTDLETGRFKRSNIIHISFVDPLYNYGLEDPSDVTICYGTIIPSIVGRNVDGGRPNYTYQWYSTTTPEIATSWKAESGYNSQAYSKVGIKGNGILTETKYFRRRATDACGTNVWSEVKRVAVMDDIPIEPEDINYNHTVADGKSAKMWGVPRKVSDDSRYVWFNSQWQAEDTTNVSEFHETSNLIVTKGDNQIYTYYAKKIDASGQCLSYASDTLQITAYSRTSGDIYVNGVEEGDADKFWKCAGDKDVLIVSENDPDGAVYTWYSRIGTYGGSEWTVGDWSVVRRSADNAYARGQYLNLDTCTLSSIFNNTSGRPKFIELRRLAVLTLGDEEIQMYSNTVRVNIIPTMESVTNVYDVAGKLTTDKLVYCKGEEAQVITGNVDVSDETWSIWTNPNKYFGPWMFDSDYEPDGIMTWFEFRQSGGEYDTATIYRLNDNGYARTFIAGSGSAHAMNETWNVRRAVSDGCSSAYSNILTLRVADAVGKLGNVETYAYADGSPKAMYKGFEIGDSLIVGYVSTDGASCRWALDSLFTDLLEVEKSYVGIRLSETNAIKLMRDPHIYMQRKSNDCWSSTLSIPISLGTRSAGGRVGGDQQTCAGTEFNDIESVLSASGDWISPAYTAMNWKYSWQYSKDTTTWVDIAGAGSDSAVLKAELVNRYTALMSGNESYFRRVAVNDSGRVRYSNIVSMSYLDPLKAGAIVMDSVKAEFCSGETLPELTTTEATGGRVASQGCYYNWQARLDDGSWFDLSDETEKCHLDFSDSLATIDRSVTHSMQVRCVYTDGEIGCGSVTSDSVTFTLYRENTTPSIYQVSDSCDAEEITIKVVAENIAKTYTFSAIVGEDEDSTVWEKETDIIDLKRDSISTSYQYTVQSVDNSTGCVSGYYQFAVDSLPALQQSALQAPAVVCYNEKFTVSGNPATGGNGEKTYQWQYSYDGEEWNEQAGETAESVKIETPKVDVYFRRIVSDMCASDTTEPVYVRVMRKIDISASDLIINDFQCEGRSFNVRFADSLPRTTYDYYATYREDDWSRSVTNTFNGFEGDSMSIIFRHINVDSLTGYTCESRKKVYAYNAQPINHDENVIACDETTPCNETPFEVTGTDQTGRFANKVTYKWEVSSDGEEWKEQLLKTGRDVRLIAKDTMFIRRLANNGCINDTSNMVTVIGKKILDYDYVATLGIEVTSDMTDSSVVLTMPRGKNFEDSYYFLGDGTMPVVESNTVNLPYTCNVYRDSLLQLSVISDQCISRYTITPLCGGVISFDGTGVLCEGDNIPPIVATNIEGGNGEKTYQWQYRNVYTGEFIDIAGANEKEYTPKPVNVATDYRRFTTSAEYSAYSNVVTISIRPLPVTSVISASITDSVLKAHNLSLTANSVEKLPGLEFQLTDSVMDADNVVWQKSVDGKVWDDATASAIDSNRAISSIAVDDTVETVWYRIIAINTCGADTSASFKIITVYAPDILDDELVLVDSVCRGNSDSDRWVVKIEFKKNYGDAFSYTYSFNVNNVDKAIAISEGNKYTSDTMRVSNGIRFINPKASFDVKMTRYVNATGSSSSKILHFVVDTLQASFAYNVDKIEFHYSGEAKNSVRLNQGSRVEFTPIVTGGEGPLTYKWNLIDPINSYYYETYGGSIGREGLTSSLQSPVCYFYNKGNYAIQLEVSDGFCTANVSDKALYIDEKTARVYRDAIVIGDENREKENEAVYCDVYPTKVKTSVTLTTNSTEQIDYAIYSVRGTMVTAGSFSEETRINMGSLPNGVYLIRIMGQTVKVVVVD